MEDGDVAEEPGEAAEDAGEARGDEEPDPNVAQATGDQPDLSNLHKAFRAGLCRHCRNRVERTVHAEPAEVDQRGSALLFIGQRGRRAAA